MKLWSVCDFACDSDFSSDFVEISDFSSNFTMISDFRCNFWLLLRFLISILISLDFWRCSFLVMLISDVTVTKTTAHHNYNKIVTMNITLQNHVVCMWALKNNSNLHTCHITSKPTYSYYKTKCLVYVWALMCVYTHDETNVHNGCNNP